MQRAGQQHRGAWGGQGEQSRLQQAGGAVDPEPTAIGPKQLSDPDLGLGHRPLRLQGSANLRQLRQIPDPPGPPQQPGQSGRQPPSAAVGGEVQGQDGRAGGQDRP